MLNFYYGVFFMGSVLEMFFLIEIMTGIIVIVIVIYRFFVLSVRVYVFKK